MRPRFGSFQGEVNHLKTWLSDRAEWIDAQFLHYAAYRGCEHRVLIRCRRLIGFGRGLVFLLGRGRFRRARAARLDLRQYVIRLDHGTVADELFAEHSVGRCGHFEHDLVRLEVNQILVTGDRIASLFVPGDQRRVANGFG